MPARARARTRGRTWVLLHSEWFATRREAMSREWHLKRDRKFRKTSGAEADKRTRRMSIFKEPKIDCHAHVFDPVAFPYGDDIDYKPSGQEIGTPPQLDAVMKTYGVTHALLVQPNSGYGSDNSCMLDTIARGNGRFKGIAIIDFDADLAALRDLQAQGIVGAAFNPTFHGIDYYKKSAALIERLAKLDMFLQLQCEYDQLSMFVPWIEATPVRVLIDHCGRPTPQEGLQQAGFQALLRLAATGRVQCQAVRLLEILQPALSVRGHMAVRPRHRRGIHARPLSMGVGLAVFARAAAAGFRPAGRTR